MMTAHTGLQRQILVVICQCLAAHKDNGTAVSWLLDHGAKLGVKAAV